MTQPAVTNVGSNSTNRWASNFWRCLIALNTERADALACVNPDFPQWTARCTQEHGRCVFISTEHAWQALKARDYDTFMRFTERGDLSAFSPNFWVRIGLLAIDAARKFQFWSRLGPMVGILAKLATNPKYGAALQLGNLHMMYTREHLPANDERAVWMILLRSKFLHGSDLRAQLKATGTSTIIEFDRLASPTHASYWGGRMLPSGHVIGANTMGQYLMIVRDLY